MLPGGEHPVRTVGIVSGGAARDIRQAAAAGLDAFITGEPSEDAAYLAAELGVEPEIAAAGIYRIVGETMASAAPSTTASDALPSAPRSRESSACR